MQKFIAMVAVAMAALAFGATTAAADPVDVTLPGTTDECDPACTFWVSGEMDLYYKILPWAGWSFGDWDCPVIARGEVHDGGYMYIHPMSNCESGGANPVGICWDGPNENWTGPIEHDGEGNIEPIVLSNVCLTWRGTEYRGQATMELEPMGDGEWSFLFDDQAISPSQHNMWMAGDLDEWIPLGTTGFDLHPVYE